MFDTDRETRPTNRLSRRTVLKGTVVTGLLGVPGIASASEWHEITFTSVSDEVFEYWFEVSGEVKRGGTYQSDDGDEVGENAVRGRCAGGRSDSFLFTGERVSLEVSGPGKVLVDGEVVMDRTEAVEDRTERAITFRAADEEPAMYYEFDVSGDVERGRDTDDGDVVSGSNVTGAVGEGRKDTFSFTGALEWLVLDGLGSVSIDPATSDGKPADDAPFEVIVSSPETDDLLEYVFAVTGNLVELEPDEDSPPATDEVIDAGDRMRVDGALTTGDDRFAYSGDLVLVDVPEGVQVEIRDR